MSKTTYVEFAGSGLWCYDLALAGVVKLACDAVAEGLEPTTPDWLRELLDTWVVQATVGDLGLELDSARQRGRTLTVAGLLDRVGDRLPENQTFSSPERRSWVLRGGYRLPDREEDLTASQVIDVATGVVAILKGTLPKAPSGREWIAGLPGGRQLLDSHCPDQ